MGIVKKKVYEKKPENVVEMREFIIEAFEEIGANVELCHKVCNSVQDRLQGCINADGGLFEHLRD